MGTFMDLERFMLARIGATTVEVRSSHASPASQPDLVARADPGGQPGSALGARQAGGRLSQRGVRFAAHVIRGQLTGPGTRKKVAPRGR
jgi:hypothetical protein